MVAYTMIYTSIEVLHCEGKDMKHYVLVQVVVEIPASKYPTSYTFLRKQEIQSSCLFRSGPQYPPPGLGLTIIIHLTPQHYMRYTGGGQFRR